MAVLTFQIDPTSKLTMDHILAMQYGFPIYLINNDSHPYLPSEIHPDNGLQIADYLSRVAWQTGKDPILVALIALYISQDISVLHYSERFFRPRKRPGPPQAEGERATLRLTYPKLFDSKIPKTTRGSKSSWINQAIKLYKDSAAICRQFPKLKYQEYVHFSCIVDKALVRACPGWSGNYNRTICDAIAARLYDDGQLPNAEY